jgi:hypothetical protein
MKIEYKKNTVRVYNFDDTSPNVGDVIKFVDGTDCNKYQGLYLILDMISDSIVDLEYNVIHRVVDMPTGLEYVKMDVTLIVNGEKE